MRFFLLLAVLFFPYLPQAQSTTDSIKTSHLGIYFQNDGQLYGRNGDFDNFIIESGGKTSSALFGLLTWFAGRSMNSVTKDDDGIRTAYSYFRWNNDWIPGMMPKQGRDTSQTIIRVTSSDIATHLNQYTSSSYMLPDNIKNWLANTDPTEHMNTEHAPFIDANSNGYYDPQNGDYPYIRGDEAVFYSYYQPVGYETALKGIGAAIQYRTLAYVVNDTAKEELKRTVFFHSWITNNSQYTYDSSFAAFYLDFDIGYDSDDFHGSDSTVNLVYAYNGDDFDEDRGGDVGFGHSPPAVGFTSLSQELYSFTPAHSFVHFDPPTTPIQQWLAVKGLAPKTGLPLYNTEYGYFGSSHNPPPAHATTTRFFMHGKPLDTTAFNEIAAGSTPFDRRGYVSMFLDTLRPGETKEITYALLAKVDPTANNLLNAQGIIDLTADLHAYFQAQNFVDPDFASVPNSVNKLNSDTENNDVEVFPNPVGKQLSIRNLHAQNGSYQVVSTDGKMITEGVLNSDVIQTIAFDYPSGVYFLIVSFKEQNIPQVLRVVKE